MFNLRGFDLNLLTVFEAIYEAGSVGRAAERLALSQAATSHALARLRQVCNDELFVRAGQKFVPTYAAQALAPKVQAALAMLRQGLAEVHGFDPAVSERHFHVSIPHPLGPIIAYRMHRMVTANAPQITIRADTRTNPPDLTDDMRAGVVDLAIDWLRIDLDQFVNKRLLDEPLMLAVRQNHPRIREATTLEQLRGECFVWLHPRRPRELRAKAAQEFEDLGLRIVVQVNEWMEVPTLVATTDLLSIVPRSLTRVLVDHLQLRVDPFPVKLTPVPIFSVWHAGRRNDPAHRWFRDLAAAELCREAET